MHVPKEVIALPSPVMGRKKHIIGKRRPVVPLNVFLNLVNNTGNSSKTGRQADQNSFDVLETIDDQEINTSREVISPTTKLPPPIFISSTIVSDVHKKIIAASVVIYTTAVTNNGTLVRTTTSNDFRAVVNYLKHRTQTFICWNWTKRKQQK